MRYSYLLTQYDVLLFRDVQLIPEQQYALVKVCIPRSQYQSKTNIVQAFDPESEVRN
jgi:hypothetical protein